MIINVSPDAVLWSGVLAQQEGLERDLSHTEDDTREGLEVVLATLITHLGDENVDSHTIQKASRLGRDLVLDGYHTTGRELAWTLQGIDPAKYGRAATAARAIISQAFRFALTSQATDRAAATLGAGKIDEPQAIKFFKTFEEFRAYIQAHDPELYQLVKSNKIEDFGRRYEVKSNLEKIALDWDRDFAKAQLAVSYLVRLYSVYGADKELQDVVDSNKSLFTAQHIQTLRKIEKDGLLKSPRARRLTYFINQLKLARPDLFQI